MSKMKVLIFAEAIVIGLIVFLGTFLSYFKDVPTLNRVMVDSGTYAKSADLVRLKLKVNVPEEVKNDPIAYGAINWGIDRFIDEGFIERITQPTLLKVSKISKSQTEISGETIVLKTEEYKKRLTANLADYELPSGLKVLGQKFIDTIPQELNIIDLKSDSGSIFGKIISFRNNLAELKTTYNILLLVAVFILGLIAYINRKSISGLIRKLGQVVLLSSTFVLLVATFSYIAINSLRLYSGVTTEAYKINELITGLSTYYLKDLSRVGLIMLAIGIVIILLTNNRTKKYLNTFYNNSLKYFKENKNVPARRKK